MPDSTIGPLGLSGLVFACALGAIVGSFLNVVAHRLPLELSVVRPGSRCPTCRTPVRAVDNVPVLSWLWLGGRCRGCKGRISARYALVELLSGLLAAAAFHVLVRDPGLVVDPLAWARWAVVLAVTSALLAASLIDLDHRILPDQITKPGMWAGPVACAFVPELVLGASRSAPSWVPGGLPVPLQAALVSAVGVAVGAGTIWGLGVVGTRVFKKEAMGFGDVKFLGLIGGFVGPLGALIALLVAAVVGAAAGLVRLLLTGDRYIPFGPFLAIGGYVELLYGSAALDWYLDSLRGALHG
jgi:leader peptidase (prepilin peptidase)/N-methyltransferase